MITQNRIVVIDAGDKSYTFRVRIHRSESPSEQLIDPAFYLGFENKLHGGIHHEIELVASPVWERINPDVPIHIHENPESKRRFICFTGNIARLEIALTVLRAWCVGTVYTITHNEDFSPVAQEAGGNFLELMKEQYGIVISRNAEECSDPTKT